MDELEELYQDIILDHYRNPRGEGELDPFTGMSEDSIRSAETR